MSIIVKKEIKYIEDQFVDFNIKLTLELLEKTAPRLDIKKKYGLFTTFKATGGYWDTKEWELEKLELSSDMWRAIYKYSDEYGEFNHSNADFSVFEKYVNNKNIKILDFGPGPNPLGVGSGDMLYGHPNFINRSKCEFHLVELNDRSREKIIDKFNNYSNVFVYENLSEVFNKDIKFDYIFSHDCLEHVRYINEHLYLLYFLCIDGGIFDIKFEYGQITGGHVSGLYEDTIIDPTLFEAFKIKDNLQPTSKHEIKKPWKITTKNYEEKNG